MDSNTLALSFIVGVGAVTFLQYQARQRQQQASDYVNQVKKAVEEGVNPLPPHINRAAKKVILDKPVQNDPLLLLASDLSANKDQKAFEQKVSSDTSVYLDYETAYNL